jgi:quercetin dioxygenase-like cupin family protein
MQQSPPGELIRVGEMGIRFLVEAADSNDSVTVFECFVPANAKMPAPHSHDGFEETVYGLEGTTTYTIDGQDVELGPGSCVCIPRGTVHAFRNAGDTDAKLLAIASPGVFGPSYFRDIAEVLARAPGGPPDIQAMGEVMRRHGLTPAPPPGR